jgi:serine/threonine protein kinase
MTDLAGDVRRNYGPYEVEGVLGRGAMGMVYLARDRRIGRKVALKTVLVEERFEDESEANEFYKRLQREAELCGSLQHPNIVTLYEPGYDNDVIAWLATEYIDGESLRDRMKKRKPLPISEALRIAEDILRGLAFAHSKGIVHRDIKPANILLTAAGEAKIADFGIARPLDSNLTAVGEMLGTPSYMSPEQVKCTAVTARSDLFSAGAVLYEMATGVKAFAASDVSGILRNVVEVDPRPAHAAHAQVPAVLSMFLGKMMSKDPEARYPSAGAALQDLQAIRETVNADPVEEVGPAEALSTLASSSRRGPETQSSSVTSTSDSDLTPAISTRTTSSRSFDRTIPASFFAGVIATLLIILGGIAAALYVESEKTPEVFFTDAQLVELAAKRESLESARSLYSAGEYERSLKAYDAYIARYPASPVAKEEREEARLALDAEVKSASAVEVPAKRPRKKPAETTTTPAKTEEPKRPWWRRVFRRN